MKLQDRISEIEGFDFCKRIIKTEDISNPNDVEEFGYSVKHVHLFDVSGSVMTITKIPLYVLNEGTDEEEAFFMDKYPQSRVQGNTVVTEVEEAEDGSINEVKKVITSTGEKKEIDKVTLIEAVTIEKPVDVVEDPIKEVVQKG